MSRKRLDILDDDFGETEIFVDNRWVALARFYLIAFFSSTYLISFFTTIRLRNFSSTDLAYLSGFLVSGLFVGWFIFYNIMQLRAETKSSILRSQFRRPFIILFLFLIFSQIITKLHTLLLMIPYQMLDIQFITLIALLIALFIIMIREFNYLKIQRAK